MNVRARVLAAATVVFFAAVTAAFAQVRPIDAGPPHLRPPVLFPQRTPSPASTPDGARPMQTPRPAMTAHHLGAVAPGARVPLALLPRLPMQTLMNHLSKHNRRPMAADGSTITVTQSSGCTGTTGVLYNVGCAVTWKSSGAPAGSTYQDYYIAPGAGTAVAATPGGTYTTTPPTENQTFNAAGVWTLAVYDITTGNWETVVYVNVGTATTIKVYQDAFHSAEGYQFDVNSSPAAYIDIAGVAASDLYVVYVETTSVHPRCVFMAPSTGLLPANSLCNPTSSAGITAPGSDLSITWPLNTSLPAGTYSVVVYDKTINQRLGQVQVSLTGVNEQTLTLKSDATYANPSPNPRPAPAAGTVFAWDSVNDQSTSGVTLTSSANASSPFWSVTDPTGRVVGTSAGGSSYLFNFQNAVGTPGYYPPKIFTATLYDQTSKTVVASQAFQIVGYYLYTTFHTSANGDTQGINVTSAAPVTADLKFENQSAQHFGAQNAESFAEMAFTTGSDFTHIAGNGSGVYAVLNGFTMAQCQAAAGCSTTVTDSNGAAWTVTDYCSASGGFFTNGECNILARPVNPSTLFTPGDTLDIPSVTFSRDFWANCLGFFGNSTCPGSSSGLPVHGMTWSSIASNDAANNVTFNSSWFAGTLAGTADVKLAGAISQSGTSFKGTVEGHLYQPYSAQVAYARSSPYALTTGAYDIYAIKVTNNSSNSAIQTIALGLPGSYGTSTPASNNFRLDTVYGNPAGWQLLLTCPGSSGYQGTGTYICLDGSANGVSLAAGASTTFYIDANPPQTSFGLSEWTLYSVAPQVFNLTADGSTSVPVSGMSTPLSAPTTVDTLAFGMYSLDSTQMGTSFSPSSAGQGTTPAETIVVQNTSASADPNPDYLDNVVLELPNGSVSGTPTTSTPGWSYLGTVSSGGNSYYWFSACNNAQDTAANLPPAATPLTGKWNVLPACTAAKNAYDIPPGGTLSVSMNLQNLTTAGNFNATMFAHGANGDGWTSGKTFSLTVTSIAASVGFTGAGGYPSAAAVPSNSVPAINGNVSTTYGNAYTYTIKNNSSGQNITYARIRIPGTDIGGVNATDSTGKTWTLTGTGQSDTTHGPYVVSSTDGCTVTAFQSATTAGGDGYIDIGSISGSTCALKPGDTLTVSFDAISPDSQGDEYQFSTTNINNVGVTGGENWLGDTDVKVSLSIGLNVVVDPSNPGPGGSTPSVACTSCNFAGTTIDFGPIANSTAPAFSDVARASVYLSSSTPVSWTLAVSANTNPARTPATPTNELLTSVDSANSTSTGVTYDQTSYAVVPTAGTLQIAHGTSVTSRSAPYDVLQNFQVNIGTEALQAQQVTITYTLIAN